MISTVLIAIYFVLIWLVTRFYKPKRLEIKFATPWKDSALAIGYVVGLFLAMGVVFFFLEDVAGVPIGTSKQFDIKRAFSGESATISLISISLLIKTGKQSFETVDLTKKNMRLSLGMGLIVSLLFMSFSTTPERLMDRLFAYNTLYAFIYSLAVGLGEELMFRGLL